MLSAWWIDLGDWSLLPLMGLGLRISKALKDKMKIKVVYIDDEVGLCQSFVDNFSNPLLDIKTFTDPLAGIAYIKVNLPDFVFLDYRLPNTTGNDLIHEIPEDIPVALITGDWNIKASSRFVRVFEKPFKFNELEEFLAAITPRTRTE